jgi:hypothetical protein
MVFYKKSNSIFLLIEELANFLK